MTESQFTALAQLLRLRGGASQEVARLVMVVGLSVSQAAQMTGIDLRLAQAARACTILTSYNSSTFRPKPVLVSLSMICPSTIASQWPFTPAM